MEVVKHFLLPVFFRFLITAAPTVQSHNPIRFQKVENSVFISSACPIINTKVSVNEMKGKVCSRRTFKNYTETRILTSFPVMHKVDNIDIFVQFLMQIIWKQLRMESIIEITDFSIFIIFKNNQIQKCQRCQLCVLRENSLEAQEQSYNLFA